jgi:UPF0176 protein
MVQLSPKATVPVLVLPTGQVLEESLDIMVWACQTLRIDGGDNRVVGSEAKLWSAELLVDPLIATNDDDFKRWLDRYKYADRNLDFPPERSRAEAARHLATIEKRLAENSYLAGTGFGALDAAIVPFIRQFAGVDQQWFCQQPWPRTISWLNKCCMSSAFQRVMIKQETWDPQRNNGVILSWIANK